MDEQPLELTISGDAGSAFRSHFGIDSAAQAREALADKDALFAAGGHPWNDRETFDWAAEAANSRFEKGIYKDGELAGSKPTEDGQDLWGSSTHVANESSEWKAVCIAPDYCKVGNSVVPFDSYADIGNQTRASPDVTAAGTPIYRVDDMHKGIEADAGEGIPSGTSQGGGYVKFLTGQDNVKVNGLPIVRQDSLCLVNCNAAGLGGAMGKVVTAEKSAQTSGEEGDVQEPNDALQTLIDKAEDKRSWWQKTKDFTGSAWESTKRIADASWNDPENTALGVLKGVGNLPSDLWNLAVLASKYQGPVSPALMSDALQQSALQAYQAGNTMLANALATQASEIMSTGYIGDIFELTGDAQTGGSVLSMLVPVGTIAKGLGTAGKAARGMKAADIVADAARVDHVADGIKAGDAVSDVGKAMDTEKAAGDAGKAGSSRRTPASSNKGVHVRSRVATKPNTAFFWSGRSKDASGKVYGGAKDAERIAKEKGGTTLEMLIEERGIKMPLMKNPNVTRITTIDPASGVERLIYP